MVNSFTEITNQLQKIINEANRIGSGVRLDEIPAKLKHLKVLGRGATSIALEKDPDTVILLTRDSIKRDWILQDWGLGIGKEISDSIISYKNHIRDLRELPIYVIEMPKLYPLSSDNRKLANELVKLVDQVKYSSIRINHSKEQLMLEKFFKIIDEHNAKFKNPHKLETLVNFLSNYNPSQYYWDFAVRNMKQTKTGELVLLDPIVDSNIIKAFKGTN